MAAAAALVLGLTACPPKIPHQPAAMALAQEPVFVEPVVDPDAAGPLVELVMLAGGSRWDAPGQEGQAWHAAMARPHAPTVTVHVGRDHAWYTLVCPSDAASCVGPVDRLLGGFADRAGLVDQAADALSHPDPTDATRDVLYGLLYEAHPYGHPVVGRLGALDPTTQLRPGWETPRFTRGTILARAVGRTDDEAATLTRLLGPSLARLPAVLPPDAAMKGPPPARGITVARLPIDGDQVSVHVGVVLSRRATNPTRMRPSSDEITAWTEISACLTGALPGYAWDPPTEAPPGWQAALTTPLHPALVWSLTGSVDEVAPALERLPERLLGVPDAITDACSSDPAARAETVRGALDAGYTVVIGVGRDIEDPSLPDVEGDELLDLPAPAEGLFR